MSPLSRRILIAGGFGIGVAITALLVLSDIEARFVVVCPHEQTSHRNSLIDRGA
jgi:hypothetical protein